MKFTPATRILDEAMLSGRLRPGGKVMESSSGTFALALAILCSLYGLHLTLVTGPISKIVRWRLENLGAKIRIVQTANNCEGGIQQARLEVLHAMLGGEPDAFWPQQYTNPLNALSYQPIAEQLYAKLPQIDTVVGAVGSGGSLFGIGGVLQRHNPGLKIVAVDHNRSVIFGAEPARITRMCRETFEQMLVMGAGIPMGNVRHENCDEVHWVPVPKMIQEVHAFHRDTGFLVGPSSGAALAVASYEAKRSPRRTVLAILPDHGMRYTETMFNPSWLENWPEDLRSQWREPRRIDTPLHVLADWCVYKWNRSSFEAVLGHAPKPRRAGFNP